MSDIAFVFGSYCPKSLSFFKSPYSAQAKATYQKEVTSLKAKLNLALENAPRERQAQIMANAAINSIISTYKKDHPGMTKEEEKEFKKLLKKTKNQVLMDCRRKVGSKRQPVEITSREWEAIQAGAISENVLTQILNNTDVDKVKELATPRAKTTPSEAKINPGFSEKHDEHRLKPHKIDIPRHNYLYQMRDDKSSSKSLFYGISYDIIVTFSRIQD